MTIWDMLGIGPTVDVRTIKRAYAQKVKICHPEDDPDGFRKLQEAYRKAMDYAHGKAADDSLQKEAVCEEGCKKAVHVVRVEEVQRIKRTDVLFNEVNSSHDTTGRIEVVRHLLKGIPCINEQAVRQLMQNEIMRMYLDDPCVVKEADNYLSSLPVKGNVADIKKFYALLEEYNLPQTKAKVEKNVRIRLIIAWMVMVAVLLLSIVVTIEKYVFS